MIKKALTAIVAFLAAFSCYADEMHFNRLVTDGTLSVTNSASSNFEVSSVVFKYPSACTNTLTISRIRPFETDTKTTVIITNAPLLVSFGLKDAISTNVYNAKTITYVTNVLFSASTTNETNDIAYGELDLDTGFCIAANDIVKFDWSYTALPIYVSIDAE